MTSRAQCWSCTYQQIGGGELFGFCRWFESRGEAKKAIPSRVVDVGCQYWIAREAPTRAETPNHLGM